MQFWQVQTASILDDAAATTTMAITRLNLLSLIAFFTTPLTALSLSTPSPPGGVAAIVGAGISGLTIAHVLQASGRYQVEVFEADPHLGGHIRSLANPRNDEEQLNIGHATHMGMFVNLRLLLRHFGVSEWPVGRGPNDEPGLFRMISVTGMTGDVFRPPLKDITSPSLWWEAFQFYFASYMNPDERLDHFLARNHFSKQFMDILYWAMATFEFDKRKEEAGEYAVGAARALLITRVFFQYLLCDAFEGSLPSRIDRGLKEDLASRVMRLPMRTNREKKELVDRFEELTSDAPLASYFTASYGTAIEKLAAGAGRIRTNATVTQVSRKNGRNEVKTIDGETIEADHVIFTTHPSTAGCVLKQADFPQHTEAIKNIESGAVAVRIIHASDLPFAYPPPTNVSYFDSDSPPPPVLGIFDISQLTTTQATCYHLPYRQKAGWLSVAYPMYPNTTLNHHQKLLNQIPCADDSLYPWTRATSSFPAARRDIEKLQGNDGIYITGQALTGVNKASELQVTNALNLCYDHFGVSPPWKEFFPCPMLPDCNDVDAFHDTSSPIEAAFLALKSLVGSFLLATAVSRFGMGFFELLNDE